ncbi:hypothetical protein, partial [Bifidobacterium breve]
SCRKPKKISDETRNTDLTKNSLRGGIAKAILPCFRDYEAASEGYKAASEAAISRLGSKSCRQ